MIVHPCASDLKVVSSSQIGLENGAEVELLNEWDQLYPKVFASVAE